jgi:hypothetical protein
MYSWNGNIFGMRVGMAPKTLPLRSYITLKATAYVLHVLVREGTGFQNIFGYSLLVLKGRNRIFTHTGLYRVFAELSLKQMHV